MGEKSGSTDGLVSALSGRLNAEIGRASSMASLAFAEGRLAATSVLLLLMVVLLAAVLIIVIWLLLMALLHHVLQLAGLGSGSALLILLLVHLIALAALGLFAHRLSRRIGFRETRRAWSERV